MRRLQSSPVILAVLILAGCWPSGSQLPPKTMEDYTSQERPAWRSSLDTSSSSAEFLVHGLIALASESPNTGETYPQDRAILAVVNVDERKFLPCKVAQHVPKMHCRRNCSFVDLVTGQRITTLDLAGVDLTFLGTSSESKVTMHQAELEGSTPDECTTDACKRSLRWLPRGEAMNPGPLKPGAFGRPDPELVTSQIIFEEGQAFTYDHWGSSGSYWQFEFPDGTTRAMAKTLGITVPATDGGVEFLLMSSDGYGHWRLEIEGVPAMVEISNLPQQPGKNDFTAHNLLRDKSWFFCWRVPKFDLRSPASVTSAERYGEPIALDPQCTPSNNQWP